MNIYSVCGISAAVAFVLGVILYKIFIPLLRKVKLGQKILEIGPSWHKAKEGTPNLGGLFFIIACFVAFTLGTVLLKSVLGQQSGTWFDFSTVLKYSFTMLGLGLSQGLIGFVDDYVKLFKKQNKGLSATQKMVLQFLTVAGYLFVNSYYNGYDTAITLPGGNTVELGVFYYILLAVAIVYIINCANLTDGIDGLAGSIAFIITIMFLLYGAEYCVQLALPCAALAGALLAFLVFNFHPAKIFMGDTGSLYLGGFIVGAVMLTNCELLLLPISFIWIIEGLSVMLQVASFKLTGKRIFKMSPIHHHFEKCGWSEVKIVAVFSAVTVVFCALSYYLLII